MDSSLKIDSNEIKRVVLEDVRANRSTTKDFLLDTLKLKYPNVNAVHLRYKLNKVMDELKNEYAVQEIEMRKIDFGPNVHRWAEHINLIDVNIIQCLKELDKILAKM